jgi:hypothetical protein
MHVTRTLASLLLLSLFAAPEPLFAQPGVVFDVGQNGFFDKTDEAYPIENGRTAVDLRRQPFECPTGLGQMATGREAVNEILLVFQAARSGEHWLHVTWHPGGSGSEQFEVACNGASAGKSPLVEAQQAPYQQRHDRFQAKLKRGKNEITLRRLSGDGLHFANLVLCQSDRPPSPLKPNLEFPTLEAYEAEIKEPGVMLDGLRVRLFAPARAARQANIIFELLVKAYEELYRLVGVGTQYRIVVYHFPEGSEHAWGGTSNCTIWYSYENLDLMSQREWREHGVPHVCGYIEEMAHNFVAATRAQFGWEMIGWTIGTKVSQQVAGNPIYTALVDSTRTVQAETFSRYVRAGYVFPADVEANLCDRIHAYLLWRAEAKYGPGFWPDFFREIRKERARLEAISESDADQRRNRRYQITLDCFDRLPGLKFKQVLANVQISLTTDVKSLHPTKPGWNRRFVPEPPETP